MPLNRVPKRNQMIRKRNSEWVVVSHKTGKVLGRYKTRAEAERRLAQIRYFKHKGK